jgi:putative intracellular protease/amidase
MPSSSSTLGSAKRILMIVANPAISPVTGWEVGFWAAELAHPWVEFTRAGYLVRLASPDGGRVAVDGYSDPRDPDGFSTHDVVSLGFLTSPKLVALLEDTPSIGEFTPDDFDAVFVCGGQSPMLTFRNHEALQSFVVRAYEADKVVAVLCHGTCLLLGARLNDGRLLVEGKTWTGFANSEEDFAEKAVGRTIHPFRIETEARAIPGTNFITHNAFTPFAVRDGRLITGQQVDSGLATAKLVIEALGR